MNETRISRGGLLAVAPEESDHMISLLNFAPSETVRGGWDGAKTRGENVRSSIRETEAGSIGMIEISGPLWTSDDIAAWWLGLTTYESIGLEIRRMRDSGIAGIVLSINSYGGRMDGVDELGELIRETSKALPLGVVSHVYGIALSAGYYLAAAAGKIVASKTAGVGSIGAIMGIRKGGAGSGYVTFVSSQSPLKNSDPETGAEQYQQLIDDAGAVFVGRVAEWRGVSVETVLSDFGRGSELLADRALGSKMIDSVGSLEYAVSQMVRKGLKKSEKGISMNEQEKKEMTAETVNTETVNAADPAVIAAAERERCAAILNACEGTPLAGHASGFITSGVSLDDVNAEIVAAMKAAPAPAPAPAPTPGLLAAMSAESEIIASLETTGETETEKNHMISAISAGIGRN